MIKDKKNNDILYFNEMLCERKRRVGSSKKRKIHLKKHCISVSRSVSVHCQTPVDRKDHQIIFRKL